MTAGMFVWEGFWGFSPLTASLESPWWVIGPVSQNLAELAFHFYHVWLEGEVKTQRKRDTEREAAMFSPSFKQM